MRFQKSIFILLIGIVLLSSINIINNISVKSNNIDVAEIENNLHLQEDILQSALTQFVDTNLSKNKLEDENITILKFKGNSLIYWSDNSINFNNKNADTFNKKGAFKIGSRIFIS